MPQPNSLGLTLTIKLDQTQYNTIVGKLNAIQQLIVQSTDDPAKLQALTDRLKQSEEALKQIVAQNQ